MLSISQSRHSAEDRTPCDTVKKDAGLYIHIPFCESKCHYCAFNSRPRRGQDISFYLAALFRQMETMARHPWSKSHRFTSLFIGGGTPTIYDSDSLCRLVDQGLGSFSFVAEPEISIEANPETVEIRKLRRLKAAGVNRISIGVQSFDDDILAAIGRNHSAETARGAILTATEAGFTNVNLDLIFGLPGQNEELLEKSIETALAFGVNHLAVYELMVEEHSILQRLLRDRKLALPPERETVAMLKKTGRLLKAAGKPGYRCLHNLNYWQNGSYLGLGAGAVSCFSGLRLVAEADPAAYVKAIDKMQYPYVEGEALSEAASLRETMILGLRRKQGIGLAAFRQAYPAELWKDYSAIIDRLCGERLLVRRGRRLRLSARGLMLANRVLAELV
jgi:oxygen-independent coproporphyrinogen-3 oxidase